MPTTFEIHPSIGISRVGTSPESFVGPEPRVRRPRSYRDKTGRLLRQAARFRVFECERNDQGQLVQAREVGPEGGVVEWTVHLANRKAEGPLSPPPPSRRTVAGSRRNAGHAKRSELIIDPGPRTLAGPEQSATFDTGRFKGTAVTLGDARTDSDNRLIVAGGFGRSDGPAGAMHFSNNDGWFDDVSDGPVTASVRVSGQSRPAAAAPAWLIVAPPDFAPPITNLVTLYDVCFQAAVERGWLTVPQTPSFTQHILPILSRAVGYSWVIHLASAVHGTGGPGDFTEPGRLAALADPAGLKARRQLVLDRLRDPSNLEAPVDRGSMPRLHDETNSENVLAPTKSQYEMLERWVDGQFVNDLGRRAPTVPAPDALDRMALESCAGGPFFPGIEVGRIVREAERYIAPFRLDAARLRAGDLTEGNAVPWQADFLLCRFGDRTELGWWPAQRPDTVLVDAASRRTKQWARGVAEFRDMVEHWHELGVVVPGTDGDGRSVFVESERRLPG